MVFGVGVNDMSGICTEEFYVVWYSMLRRCYSEIYQVKKPTYRGVTVCDEWKRLSVFRTWFNERYVQGFQLDKDVLVKGNKVYSPSTCCFLPMEINSVLISGKSKNNLPIGVYYKVSNGKYCAQMSRSLDYNRSGSYIGLYNTPEDAFMAYKVEKESRLKELAMKWKDKIDPRAYNALMNYVVEITD